mgnify:CR=1 FL=1
MDQGGSGDARKIPLSRHSFSFSFERRRGRERDRERRKNRRREKGVRMEEGKKRREKMAAVELP